MTLLLLDGFDAQDKSKWNEFGMYMGFGTTGVRTGSRALYNTQSSDTWGPWTTHGSVRQHIPVDHQDDEIIVGCFVNFSGSTTIPAAISFYNGFNGSSMPRMFWVSIFAGQPIKVYFPTNSNNSEYSTNQLQVGTLLAESTEAFPVAPGGAYVEVRAYVHDTAGRCVVRLNGQTVIDYTGDTRWNTVGTAVIKVVSIGPPHNNFGQIDDLYILAADAVAPNDFLGDVRVETLTVSGTTSAGLTGSDGDSTDNHLLVDELPVSDADYVQGDTAGQRDVYTLTNLPAGSSVKGVQVSARALKDDAGERSLRFGIRSGGSESTRDVSLSTTAASATHVVGADPATSAAWTEAGVNGAEVVVEVV